jgi:iron complex outermembrane receptor protein
MVPGMQVGQIQGGPWAVSARGFNDQYANKLLVLVDGRSVYSPVNAGVTWEELDTLLEDIVTIRPYTRATIGRSFFVKLTWGF